MSFNFKPLQRSTTSRSNWGAVKFGDAVAVAFLRAGLKKQYGIDFEIGITHHEDCAEILDFIGNGLFRAKENDAPWPIPSYVNIWALAYYANKVLEAWPEFPVTETRTDSICLVPIFEAGYNLDRLWQIEFAEQLARELLKTGREVVVCGAKWNVQPFKKVHNLRVPKFEGCRVVLDSVADTVKEIKQCGTFISGDSGFTHFASALETDCKIVSIYGAKSKDRIRNSINDIGKYVTLPPPDFGYAPLVRPSHEWLYREFPEININEVVNFCK